MAFGRPDVISLLNEVAGVRLIARKTEGESIQWLVILSHQILEIQAFIHIADTKIRRRIVALVEQIAEL